MSSLTVREAAFCLPDEDSSRMRNLLSRILFLVCGAVFLGSPALAGTIVFFGDSLTAGLGVEEGQAFPALIEEKIQAERLPFSVVNAGVSGDTSAGGLRRIDWLLQQPIDILVLELGANDGLRGLPVSTMKTNLQAIIDKVKAKNPKAKIVLAGMRMPPNLGGEYADDFREAFVDLARSNNAVLIPFLLEAVAGHLDLNQADQIHPTAAGQKIVAENVWRVLEPLLEKNGS
jgi:acyl-CoA thioesterase I